MEYIKRNAFLIDRAGAGSIILTWHADAPISGEVTLRGYGRQAAPTEARPGEEG